MGGLQVGCSIGSIGSQDIGMDVVAMDSTLAVRRACLGYWLTIVVVRLIVRTKM